MVNPRVAMLLAAVLVLPACRDDDEPEDVSGDTEGGSQGESEGDTDGDGEPADDPLTAAEVLTRASLDVRGRRPTLAELDAVTNDPAALDPMIAAFVDDPGFAARIKGFFAGGWRTRIDSYPGTEGFYETGESAFNAAVGEEPLNLIAYIAVNDLPYTELVQSTDTFVDPLLLDAWPLEQVEGGPQALPAGTVRARYTDGRPLAGVLSYNSVYWRHSSTVENANRGRTNALNQALLCQSYLDRPIDFPTNLDLTDSESIQNAIKENIACQGCHSTLDPFASYLWGFMYSDDLPEPDYAVEQERSWQIYTDTPPGYFGLPGQRLVDLGDQVSQDERFIGCAVQRVYEGMLGRKAQLEDEGALAEHREVFLGSNLSLKALVRSVLTDPNYRGERWQPRFGGTPEPVFRKVAPVDVLTGSIAELSGYRLSFDGRPATRLDFGVRTLAGGSDRGDTQNVSTGAVLVQRRLAEGGAMFLVENARTGQPNPGRLGGALASANLGQAPPPEKVVELVRIARTTTLAADDPELLALVQLWNDVAAISSPQQAWTALVTAILSDPDHLLY